MGARGFYANTPRVVPKWKLNEWRRRLLSRGGISHPRGPGLPTVTWAVLADEGFYVPVSPTVARRAAERGKRVVKFIVPHNMRQLEALVWERAGSRGRGLNLHIPKSLEPGRRLLGWLMGALPQALITVSEYRHRMRVARLWRPFIGILKIPPGGIVKWTDEVYRTVAYWRRDCGMGIGEIIRSLAVVFGIHVSMYGFFRHRWRFIKPYL
jgi:hypothetical protein